MPGVYAFGSACGKRVKIGSSPTGEIRERIKQAKKGYYATKYPHMLAYVYALGNDDRRCERLLHEHFAHLLCDRDEHGREAFNATPELLDYIAWLRMQWFTSIDAEGNEVPEAVDYHDFDPSVRHHRTSERVDPTLFHSPEENPFWELPEARVEPHEDFHTPPKFADAVREAFGGVIEFDPSSHPAANRTVKALQYLTKEMNGLIRPWRGKTYLNPHKHDMMKWAKKAVEEIHKGNVTELICLAGSRTAHSEGFEDLLDMASAYCVIVGRGPIFLGKGQATGNNSSDRWSFTYIGPNPEQFCVAMRKIGKCFIPLAKINNFGQTRSEAEITIHS